MPKKIVRPSLADVNMYARADIDTLALARTRAFFDRVATEGLTHRERAQMRKVWRQEGLEGDI